MPWIIAAIVLLLILARRASATTIGGDVQIKPGVNLAGLQPQMVLALNVADDVYRSRGHVLTITSANDSQHMDSSLHYSGFAVDLRTKDLPPADVPEIAEAIKAQLGSQYDVIQEMDHIHVEFDPK